MTWLAIQSDVQPFARKFRLLYQRWTEATGQTLGDLIRP